MAAKSRRRQIDKAISTEVFGSINFDHARHKLLGKRTNDDMSMSRFDRNMENYLLKAGYGGSKYKRGDDSRNEVVEPVSNKSLQRADIHGEQFDVSGHRHVEQVMAVDEKRSDVVVERSLKMDYNDIYSHDDFFAGYLLTQCGTTNFFN